MNSYLNMISEKLPALGARLPGSEAHRLARTLLVTCLRELNLQPGNEGEWLQPIVESSGKVVGHNIIGIIPGKTDKYILLIAHYDTVENSPGADDNAAALAPFTMCHNGWWRGLCHIQRGQKYP